MICHSNQAKWLTISDFKTHAGISYHQIKWRFPTRVLEYHGPGMNIHGHVFMVAVKHCLWTMRSSSKLFKTCSQLVMLSFAHKDS